VVRNLDRNQGVIGDSGGWCGSQDDWQGGNYVLRFDSKLGGVDDTKRVQILARTRVYCFTLNPLTTTITLPCPPLRVENVRRRPLPLRRQRLHRLRWQERSVY
jgi:hypothetical protein